jgi:tRNA-splicing ligase RtcB (3'-phosphate/5'-hydroxy nucleic acid ligase)
MIAIGPQGTRDQEALNVPVKLWIKDLSEIESGALNQALNLARLPFAFKHIAIMPDVHQGYGMPIGGVLATQGSFIVPNAVGCFTGDTKIPLLNGSQKTLKELSIIGKDVWVYSLNKELELVVGRGTPKLTRKNAELIEIVISGGETIKCTADHKFMLLDGSYKPAKDLKPFDSLMPLYRSYESKDGYEHIRTTSGSGIVTHKMVAKQFLGEKNKSDIIHHIDGIYFNNSPDNIEYKDAKLHSYEHRKNNPIFGTETFKAKRLSKLRKNGFYAPEFANKKKQIAIQNIMAYNASDKKKEQDKLAGKRGAKYLKEYNKTKNNHKVLSVMPLDYREDVYCLTVEKYHNFAISSGIFVHNCDIGCGVCSFHTGIKADTVSQSELKLIMGDIRKVIPVGFEHHKEDNWDTIEKYLPERKELLDADDDGEYLKKKYPILASEITKVYKQLGTLGGGNHFIELQSDSNGFLCVMIHSGSRNLGKKVADFYNKKAIELNELFFSRVPKQYDLAFLHIKSPEGRNYYNEMKYCVKFAKANRLAMMERIINIIFTITGNNTFLIGWQDRVLDVAHNYAAFENHFRENVIVHRKGATRAYLDELGIIPGSQGSCSYIVSGLGNKDSFMSCSHGAGRRMSRKKARETLSVETETAALNANGILHSIRGKQDLDEAPSAYKNIDEVMARQMDLVRIVNTMTPLAVIKG